ncbi:MAG: methionine synthase, partial [Micromonosporaceae bacterium]|nr:methionine synthase [Micromonosporaceae bacterium]
VVHCCAPRAPVDLIRSAGAVAVGLDLALVEDLDPLGEALDAGLGLFAGAVAATAPQDARPPSSAEVADRVRGLWGRLGFPPSTVADQVVVTPACGLAGANPEYARAALRACRETGRRLSDVD